eukprot:5039166-Alexandrium_andersonii.AAC.1
MEQSTGQGVAGDPAAGRLYGPAGRANLLGGLVGGSPPAGDLGLAAGAAHGALGFEVPPWQPFPAAQAGAPAAAV